jgi:2-iminobutanoate/2-iminopropanoate deaminase
MTKSAVSSPNAPKAIGPYSQAVRAGQFLFASGQIPLDPATGAVVEGDISAQTRRVMENLGAVLASAGLSFAHVVRTTVFLADMGEFAAVNEVYGKYFSEPYPARATVQVARLPRDVRRNRPDRELRIKAMTSPTSPPACPVCPCTPSTPSTPRTALITFSRCFRVADLDSHLDSGVLVVVGARFHVRDVRVDAGNSRSPRRAALPILDIHRQLHRVARAAIARRRLIDFDSALGVDRG